VTVDGTHFDFDQGDIDRLESFGTFFRLPRDIVWNPQPGFPPLSLENAVLHGDLNDPGVYMTLVRWYPGFMSAPHSYASDRLCVVLSGTWWINGGPTFNPATCVAVPAGSSVKRVAHAPHYDGVIAEASSPTVVAICGVAPLIPKLLDPAEPGWRCI
jgi:hypothetical protein